MVTAATLLRQGWCGRQGGLTVFNGDSPCSLLDHHSVDLVQGEHVVIAVLSGYAALIYGATSYFGGKKAPKEEAAK